jgi:ribosomal-protein-alanine N-acetyltransferase
MNLLAKPLSAGTLSTPYINGRVGGIYTPDRPMFHRAVSRRVTTTEPHAAPEVRTAVRADLLSVFRIEKRSFGQPWPYAAFEGFLDSPGFLIAELDGSVVGYVVGDTVDAYGAPIGHIKDLAVAPDHRRAGIGRTLLSRGLVALASAGVDRVKLEVRRTNGAAQSLYAEFGFESHHVIPGYYDDGEDAFVMVKHL